MDSNFRLDNSQTKWTRDHEDADVESIRFSPDGKKLAYGLFNGEVYVRSSTGSRIIGRYTPNSDNSPVSCVKWNPKDSDLLFVSTAGGSLSQFRVSSQSKMFEIIDKDSAVHAMDVSPDGTSFVTVGSDSIVKVYDVELSALVKRLQTISYKQGIVTGHQNHVFTCTYVDANTVASCGWDQNIILWDIRSGSLVRSFFGAYVCGDALLSIDDKLYSASYREKDQLQQWDVGSGQLILSRSIGEPPVCLHAYCLGATPNKEFLAVGGGVSNSVSFFRTSNLSLVEGINGLKAPVHSLDFNQRQFAYGLADSSISVDTYTIH